jgi:hypothetical protein
VTLAKAAIVSLRAAFLLASLLFSIPLVSAQKNKNVPNVPAMLTRTTPRHEVHRLQFGGSLTLSGAPIGSVTIEGWDRSEIDISADIELHAPTEDDLNRLAAVNSFIVDDDSNHISIMTTGTHDQKFLKRVAKDFPKTLIGLPWKIDYRIKLPAMTDLEINTGAGAVKLSGVEGAIRVNAIEGDADLSVTGGLVLATVQRGSIKVTIPTRGWHGLGSDIRLATGGMTINLIPGFSADINADVLRLGEIKSTFPDLNTRAGGVMTNRTVRARAGSGGAVLNFTVGDGTIEIRPVGQ